jgi:hypothetical protein
VLLLAVLAGFFALPPYVKGTRRAQVVGGTGAIGNHRPDRFQSLTLSHRRGLAIGQRAGDGRLLAVRRIVPIFRRRRSAAGTGARLHRDRQLEAALARGADGRYNVRT